MIKIINDHKTGCKWKIHLTVAINFFSLKDSEETRTMYSKSGNTEVAMSNETDKIIEDIFILFYKDTEKK